MSKELAAAAAMNLVSMPGAPLPADRLRGLLAPRIQTSALRTLQRDIDEATFASVLTFIDRNWPIVDSEALRLEPGIGQLGQSNQRAVDSELFRLAMLLVTLGGAGSFELLLGASECFYLGSEAFRLQGWVYVDCGNGHCQISGCDNEHSPRSFRRVYRAGQWVNPDTQSFRGSGEGMPSIAHGGNPIVGADFLGDLTLSSSSGPAIEESLGEALALITGHYPVGGAWLQPVLRSIAFIESPRGSSSGSSSSHPGLIFVSYPISTDHLAAQIVHECSHQYLALFHNQYPLSDGNPNELYFSPFKGTTRPLYNVLLALHAAVNIRRFTRRLIEHGYTTDYVLSEDRLLEEQIRQMFESIEHAPGLTNSGRDLVACLRTQPVHG